MINNTMNVLIAIITIAFIISISGCLGENATEKPSDLERQVNDKVTNQQVNKDILFQTSTIDALLEGVYDGNMTFNGIAGNRGFL